jgi:hypothetical protein
MQMIDRPDWFGINASAVNDRGQVVATGIVQKAGGGFDEHGYLWQKRPADRDHPARRGRLGPGTGHRPAVAGSWAPRRARTARPGRSS